MIYDRKTQKTLDGFQTLIGDCYYRIATNPENETYKQDQLRKAETYLKRMEGIILDFHKTLIGEEPKAGKTSQESQEESGEN
jgi:hypothetical protein